ncbi:LysM peptidoglycan-binding domain-containing protein [bacterium]|nr:LysM peptidoglycan-binding domain-containing protein [bacterium]
MKTLFSFLILIISVTMMAQYEIQTDNLTDVEEHTEVTVQQGDTLWDLCEKHLGDPFLWPKIWSLNPEIENPHIIEPGDRVRFYPKTGRVEIQPKNTINTQNVNSTSQNFIPEEQENYGIQISTHGNASLSLNSGNGATGFTKPRYEAIITDKELKKAGYIQSSKEEHLYLTSSDTVYLSVKDLNKINEGDIFHIFRNRKTLVHPTKESSLGYVVDIVGEVTITGKVKNRAVGKITNAFLEIERGDKILPKIDLSYDIQKTTADKKIEGKIIEFAKEVDNIGSHELVFINVGKNAGIQKGMVFHIVRRKDPISHKVIPHSKIGELVVISTNKESSTCFVTSTSEELSIGDVIVSELKLKSTN